MIKIHNRKSFIDLEICRSKYYFERFSINKLDQYDHITFTIPPGRQTSEIILENYLSTNNESTKFKINFIQMILKTITI